MGDSDNKSRTGRGKENPPKIFKDKDEEFSGDLEEIRRAGMCEEVWL